MFKIILLAALLISQPVYSQDNSSQLSCEEKLTITYDHAIKLTNYTEDLEQRIRLLILANEELERQVIFFKKKLIWINSTAIYAQGSNYHDMNSDLEMIEIESDVDQAF